MTSKEIYDYFAALLGDYGASGVCGNMQAESGFIANNLQDTFNDALKMTDEQYTAAVDNGSYAGFINDGAGYGLVQWTFWTLKRDLLEYARQHGQSIGDAGMQCDFLAYELQKDYGKLWQTLKDAKSCREASDAMLLQFERPADQSERVQLLRAGYAEDLYKKYSKKAVGDMRFLVICGHGGGDPGACGCGLHEADLNRELGALVVSAGKAAGHDFTLADTKRNFYTYLSTNTYDFTPYDVVLEVHFNASSHTDYAGNGSLMGSMFFAHPAEKDYAEMQAILNSFYALGSKKAWDGIVLSTACYRGGLLVQNRVVSQGVRHFLLETAFISDADDVKWYQSHKQQIAEAIVAGLTLKDKAQQPAQTAPAQQETKELYRVRKSWADAASQIGAFTSLDNAKAYVDARSGYNVYNSSGSMVYAGPAADVTPYMVRVKVPDLNIRYDATIDAGAHGQTGTGAFTIVAEKTGKIDNSGHVGKWGLLLSYKAKRDGWICLAYPEYTEKI